MTNSRNVIQRTTRVVHVGKPVNAKRLESGGISISLAPGFSQVTPDGSMLGNRFKGFRSAN